MAFSPLSSFIFPQPATAAATKAAATIQATAAVAAGI